MNQADKKSRRKSDHAGGAPAGELGTEISDQERADSLSRSAIRAHFGGAAHVAMDRSGREPTRDVGEAVASAQPSLGFKLPGSLQGRLESSLDADLSGVRVHTGADSAAAADGIGARAFAVGQDIHFGKGEYNPGSVRGDQLIAHEAAHTVQQQGSAQAPAKASLDTTQPGDAHETEAHAFAESFTNPTLVDKSPVKKRGAGVKLAAWWADGHREITYAVGKTKEPQFHPSIIDYVAEKAGAQDLTLQSTLNFAYHLGIYNSDKHKAKYVESVEKYGKSKNKGTNKENPEKNKENSEKNKEEAEKEKDEDVPDLKTLKRRWYHLDFHHRQTAEMPLHGEAGGYRVRGGAPTNIAAVNKQITTAAKHYKGGKHKEGMLKLSDALHSAEDRGSHGEGDPWTGHDPRLLLPTKYDGTPNENYVPGWDCDNPGKNSGGRKLAEGYASAAYDKFLKEISGNKSALKALSEGKGGKGRTGIKTYWGHGVRWAVGAGTKGITNKGQDLASKLEGPMEYQELKEKRPDPKKPTSNAMGNQQEYFSSGAFAGELLQRLQQVRAMLDAGRKPDAMEKKFRAYTRLAGAAKDLKWWCELLCKGLHENQQTEKAEALTNLIEKLDALHTEATKWIAEAGVKMKDEARSKFGKSVHSRATHHEQRLAADIKKVWPAVVPKETTVKKEEKEGGGDKKSLKQAFEKAKTRTIGQSKLILRALNNKSQGPAYLEKKEKQYSKLLQLAQAYKQTAEALYAVTPDDDDLRNEVVWGGMLTRRATKWIKRASSSGLTTRKKTRKSLGAEIATMLNWYLDESGQSGVKVEEHEETKVETKEEKKAPVVIEIEEIKKEVPKVKEEPKKEETKEETKEEKAPEKKEEVKEEKDSKEEESKTVPQVVARFVDAQQQVVLQAQIILRALNKEQRGPAYLEKKEKQYTKLLRFVKKYKSAAQAVYANSKDGWALDHSLWADTLLTAGKSWVSSASTSGFTKKKTRKGLQQKVVGVLGNYLNAVGKEGYTKGPELEEDAVLIQTDELETEELKSHIKFLRFQLQAKTIGPAYVEKNWDGYTRLQNLAIDLAKRAKTANNDMVSTVALRLAWRAADWKKRAAKSGSTQSKQQRAQLREEILHILRSIKL